MLLRKGPLARKECILTYRSEDPGPPREGDYLSPNPESSSEKGHPSGSLGVASPLDWGRLPCGPGVRTLGWPQL